MAWLRVLGYDKGGVFKDTCTAKLTRTTTKDVSTGLILALIDGKRIWITDTRLKKLREEYKTSLSVEDQRFLRRIEKKMLSSKERRVIRQGGEPKLEVVYRKGDNISEEDVKKFSKKDRKRYEKDRKKYEKELKKKAA